LAVPAIAVAIAASAIGIVRASGFPPIQQISVDIFNNRDSQHRTQVEPASYAWGSTMVSVFQAGRFYSSGGSSDIGWATSTDGGKRWKHGYLTGITKYQNKNNPYDRASDPGVAYDAKHHVWLIESLPIIVAGGPRPNEVISRSPDGLNWTTDVTIGPNTGDSDKTWIVCDNWSTSPHFGTCYAEWDSLSNGLINLSRSTDGGKTWGPPLNSHDSATGQGGVPQPQPNGNVIVPFWGFSTGYMEAFQSTNGGKSWSNTTMIWPVVTHLVSGSMRALLLPESAIDSSGKVYVVWMDCSFRKNCSENDIVMTTTTDGVHWATPAPIPIDPLNSTVDHFIPGFAVDPTTGGSSTHVALTYYYFPKGNCFPQGFCQLNVGFIASHDGGNTWTNPVHITGPMHVFWLPGTTLGFMVGDYIATSIVNGKAFGILANAYAPFDSQFSESMFAINPGIADIEPGVNRMPFGIRPVTFKADHPMWFQAVPSD
jgi:hypothetical protein